MKVMGETLYSMLLSLLRGQAGKIEANESEASMKVGDVSLLCPEHAAARPAASHRQSLPLNFGIYFRIICFKVLI